MPRIVPPRGKIPAIDSTVSGMVRSDQISPSNPSLMPMTRQPCPKIAARTAPRMTAFSPGQSPPPLAMPMVWIV